MFRRRLDVNAQTADLAATRANNLIVGSLRTPASRISPDKRAPRQKRPMPSRREWMPTPREESGASFLRVADHSPEAHERYFRRYTTVVSVSAGSPYISHEWAADSLRFAVIHFRIASCASFIRLYGPRWTATAASPAGVSVAYTLPAVSNVHVTSTPKSHSIGASG